MATIKLELTVQGINRESMEERAWGIAGQYFGDDEYEVVSSSNARYVEARSDYSITYSEGPSGFEADFVFKATL